MLHEPRAYRFIVDNTYKAGESQINLSRGIGADRLY